MYAVLVERTPDGRAFLTFKRRNRTRMALIDEKYLINSPTLIRIPLQYRLGHSRRYTTNRLYMYTHTHTHAYTVAAKRCKDFGRRKNSYILSAVLRLLYECI